MKSLKQCALFIFITYSITLQASTMPAPVPIIPKAPSLNAKSYVLMDYNSGKIIASENTHERIDPASLTKMMTMYVIDQELKAGKIKLEDSVMVSRKAWQTGGSKMFIEVNKEVSVADLIRGVIIQSGNDASVALAEHIAGSESTFANIMNHYAKNLGMHDSHFANATGMPTEDHYSTAADLAILSRALIHDFPDSYKIHSEKWFTYQGIKQPNRNRLLWRENYVDGIKTGHSDSAGFCLAASGLKDGMRLISVVIGSPSDNARTEQSQQLLRYGFRFFETHQLFAANQVIEKSRLWMGKVNTAALGSAAPLYVTLPQGRYKDLQTSIRLKQRITAPLNAGEQVGTILVKLDDEVIAEQPLVALETMSEGTLWNRAADYVSLSIHKLLNSKEI